MVVFGSLIQSIGPEGINLAEKVCFLGMGFGFNGTPVDIVGLFLAGIETKKYFILLVDEFLRFNKVPEEHILLGLQRTQRALGGLSHVYGFNPEIIISSDFMRSESYNLILEGIEQRVREQGLTERVLQNVPKRFRNSSNATIYSINEIACVEFLRREQGIEVKLGPSKEKTYDEIMRELGFTVDFAYVINAYALGTKAPEEVVHYIPEHRGKTNGQRLFLDEPIHKAKAKLILGPEEASRYLLMLASVAGQRLGKEFLLPEEIASMGGIKLRKAARRLVIENILKPYKEVVKDGY